MEEPEEPTLEEMLAQERRAKNKGPKGSRRKEAPETGTENDSKRESVNTSAPSEPSRQASLISRPQAIRPPTLGAYLADSIRRFGLAGLEARAVFEGDQFQAVYGNNPVLIHVPGPGGPVTNAYAIAIYPNGIRVFETIMAMNYADKVQEDGGPVIDQLCKIAVAMLLQRLPEAPR